MSLSDKYGRSVPGSVRLTEMFDDTLDCLNKPGDLVEVVDPPEDVELDDSSLWVKLKYEGCEKEVRLYDHEYLES